MGNKGNSPPEWHTLGVYALGRRYPWLRYLLSYVRVDFTDKVPTAAMSDSWVMYVNPEFALSEVYRGEEEAGAIRYAGLLAHELDHLWEEHGARLRAIEGSDLTQPKSLRWNIAADCAINQRRRSDEMPTPDGLLPEKYGLPRGLSTEEYYKLLPEDAEKEFGDGNGQPGHGAGSASDGIRREWEDPQEKGEGARLSEAERQEVFRKVAEKILEARNQGKLPGDGWEGAIRRAEELLGLNLRWKALLRSFVAGHARRGYANQSWSTPNRGALARRSRILTPGWEEQPVDVIVLGDTSASMGEKELGAIGGALQSALKTAEADYAWLVTFDGAAYPPKKVRPHGIKRAMQELRGGGGTLLEPGLEEVQRLIRKHRMAQPAVIIVTDGELDWPAKKPFKARFAAVITEERELSNVPDWVEFKVHAKVG